MERARIEQVAKLAGLELAPETDLEIEGDDPVLETPFHLGEGAATALGLVGQEANRTWQMRGGRAQSLRVNMRHAAASLRSYVHLQLDGAPLPERAGNPVTGIWECGDGRYIFLHASFTHGPGTLEELGLGEDDTADEIAAATKQRGAWELEDALAAKGLCVAVCREADEWAAHPQGQALASRPVVEVTKIGEAPPEPLGEAARPLGGVRVLDLTRVLAGPTCARTLAEHGAEVLHIAGPKLPTIERFEMDTGHGKRQAFLDLADTGELGTLKELVRGADVFSQGFQHRSLERRGLGAEQLAELRPGIIYVSENAFGHEGPWAERPGWEQLAQSTTGVAVTHGEERPTLAPAAMNDYTTGYFAALGTMIALQRRATEGGSWLVRVSLSQTSMWYYRLGQELDRRAASGLGDATAFLEDHDTPYGRVTHLAPPLQMSETPPRWDVPTQPIGSGEARWEGLAVAR